MNENENSIIDELPMIRSMIVCIFHALYLIKSVIKALKFIILQLHISLMIHNGSS
jgi:hypothetical protein